MKIEFSRRAKKDLDGLAPETAQRIVKKLHHYAQQEDPTEFAKALKGALGEYRFRVGKYRIVFDKGEDTIFVLRIAKRDEIYSL